MRNKTKRSRKPVMKVFWGQRPVGGQVTQETRDSRGQKLRRPLISLCAPEQITFSLWPAISQQFRGLNHLPHLIHRQGKERSRVSNATYEQDVIIISPKSLPILYAPFPATPVHCSPPLASLPPCDLSRILQRSLSLLPPLNTYLVWGSSKLNY